MKMKNLPKKSGSRAQDTLIAYRLCDIDDCCCKEMVNSLCKSISLQFLHENNQANEESGPDCRKLDVINSFINKYLFNHYSSIIFIECRCTHDVIVIDIDLIDSKNSYIVFNERIVRKRDHSTPRTDILENFTQFLRSSIKIPKAYLSDATICSIKLSHL